MEESAILTIICPTGSVTPVIELLGDNYNISYADEEVKTTIIIEDQAHGGK